MATPTSRMIPLVAPNITELDRAELRDAITFDELLTNPDTITRAYEQEIAAYLQVDDAVAVASGTIALELAIRAAGLAACSITIPAYTCKQVWTAATNADCTPWLIDLNYDIRSASFFTSRTVHIATHMFGTAMAQGIINDITLSLGGTPPYDQTVFSTHSDKMISTGRGGIIAGNQSFVDRARELATRHSVQLTAIQAALGRTQLQQLPEFIKRRRVIAAHYTTVLDRKGIECPTHTSGSVYFRYMISVPDAAATVQRLADAGIEAGRGVNPPLHHLYLTRHNYPGADHAWKHLVSVPCHPSLTDQQVEHIADQL